MEVEAQEERQVQQTMWLCEKVASLEKENEEMKRKIMEMELKIATQDEAKKEDTERRVAMECAIVEIAEHLQRQNVFNESSRATVDSLVEEVKKSQVRFEEVARILQNHEQHIARSGAASQEMAQYINALVQENEKNLWIGSLVRESEAKTQVLRQHHLGQQVLAEVIKTMARQQPPQQPPQRTVPSKQPIVTEVDDDGQSHDFQGGPSPHTRPPDGQLWNLTPEMPQIPMNMEITKRM